MRKPCARTSLPSIVGPGARKRTKPRRISKKFSLAGSVVEMARRNATQLTEKGSIALVGVMNPSVRKGDQCRRRGQADERCHQQRVQRRAVRRVLLFPGGDLPTLAGPNPFYGSPRRRDAGNGRLSEEQPSGAKQDTKSNRRPAMSGHRHGKTLRKPLYAKGDGTAQGSRKSPRLHETKATCKPVASSAFQDRA